MGNDQDVLIVLCFWGQTLKLVVLMRVSDIGQMLIYFSSSDTAKCIGSQILKMHLKKKKNLLLFFTKAG